MSRYVCFDCWKAVLCCAGLEVRWDFCTIGYLLEKKIENVIGKLLDKYRKKISEIVSEKYRTNIEKKKHKQIRKIIHDDTG